MSLKKSIAGFTTVEYGIILSLVVMTLFLSPNTVHELVAAIKAFYKSFTFFISLP
jgi:Flp pilus assembly pilin Flp